MACSKPWRQLIEKVIDGEATAAERHELEAHMKTCADCRRHFHELEEVISALQSAEPAAPPPNFTEGVMRRIERPHGREASPLLRWLKRHPIATAAAFFIVLMTGYILSLWEQAPFQAVVNGSGDIKYENNRTVVVPKGEVIKGDLIVQNGKVKIEGKVQGNVVLINSRHLMASAGEVTGDIKEINQVLEWLWYRVKQTFAHIFFAVPSESSRSLTPSRLWMAPL
ncbi:zf-HC2 domain-containing protein [Caenibacillus caldisaponilyticus]|uniref:zf-HC2 domain-containing protein n=1 Tax=Caenibacillus caldisaponilyticus TaxID=1674942 RepID=UPI00098857FE|nr:zf-HC2 domain-containing protein [Caenibacillus caldisaponilyticus]